MKSGACKNQNVRGLRAFLWSTVFTFIALALASCSSSGDEGANESKDGSTVATGDTIGQSNGAGGAQAISGAGSAAGVAGQLQAGANGAKVTAGAGGRKATAPAGPAGPESAIFPEFVNPPGSARLKTRGGATASSLEELAKTGFGSVETGVAYTGAAALATTLRDAEQYGMKIDLVPGGSMPYMAPGISEENSMQQLTPVPSEQLGSDGTLAFRGAAPRPTDAQLAPSPTRALVAVTAARVTGTSGTTTLLDPDSAVDLTSSVDGFGNLNWTIPEGTWVVFGFWQRATGQVMLGWPPFGMPDYWSARVPTQGVGSYFVADIFSGAGIGAALDYLKDNSLSPENLELLKGTQFGYDSLEVQAETFWTSDLPAEFSARRGYSDAQVSASASHAQGS